MSQNEPRDGSRPVDALDALRLLPHDGAEVIANAVNASDSPEWAMHVRGYGDHPDGWSAVVTRVVEAADPAADGTEPVAPGDERPAPDLNVAAYLMARLVREVDHLGWTEIAAHTVEQMRSLLAGLPEWCTRCEHWSNDGCPHGLSPFVAWFPPAPGSGGQTGTPGADG